MSDWQKAKAEVLEVWSEAALRDRRVGLLARLREASRYEANRVEMQAEVDRITAELQKRRL